jgi:hypothetical protein
LETTRKEEEYFMVDSIRRDVECIEIDGGMEMELTIWWNFHCSFDKVIT